MREPIETDDEARAARTRLGIGATDGEAALDAAFRAKAAPLQKAAAADRAASDALRRLIEARALLRRLMRTDRGATEPASAPSPDPADALHPSGFRLAGNGRDVEVEIALAAVEALAAAGRLRATLVAPVLRRCPACARAGHAGCGHCRGAGVIATPRRRAIPLDLERLAADDFAIEASPWADAHGRGARGGPILRATLA